MEKLSLPERNMALVRSASRKAGGLDRQPTGRPRVRPVGASERGAEAPAAVAVEMRGQLGLGIEKSFFEAAVAFLAWLRETQRPSSQVAR